jgi:hypothetical protein
MLPRVSALDPVARRPAVESVGLFDLNRADVVPRSLTAQPSAAALPAAPASNPGTVNAIPDGYSALLAPDDPPGLQADIGAIADKVLDAGYRPIFIDHYETRVDVFAAELSKLNRADRARLIAEVMRRDEGAFDSWLKAGRIDQLVKDGVITESERKDLLDAFRFGLSVKSIPADKVPAEFVRDTHDADLIALYMDAQNLDDRNGFERALVAFSGLPEGQLADVVDAPGNAALMQKFELAVQRHQDWYETLTVDHVFNTRGGPIVRNAPVTFSKEQLAAMRIGFERDDHMITNGELLLAYPDRQERNEKVTQQYSDVSNKMGSIVGSDNANWASFAVWASDEIGRNLEGTAGIGLSEAAGADPRFYLSRGNSMLVSDIGPAFRFFADTFADGKNRNMSFDQFWASFEKSHQGRDISYLKPGGDPENDMKNAMKAYYDAMKLHDKEMAPGIDPSQRNALAEQRSDLMLYANTLVGLQEQDIVDGDIDKGMTVLGMLNPAGAAGWAIDFHLPPEQAGGDARTVNTDLDITPQADPADGAGTQFTTVDGQTITIDKALRDRLNGLDGNPNNEDEGDIGNSGTSHWDQYPERMGSIFHLFAQYQHDPALFNQPRDVFPTRAKELNNDPTAS